VDSNPARDMDVSNTTGIDKILAELIHGGSSTLCFGINKLINSIVNKT
jgi:hypothetical protein